MFKTYIIMENMYLIPNNTKVYVKITKIFNCNPSIYLVS